MSQQQPNYKCPQCDHRLKPAEGAAFTCTSCDRTIRESVCTRMERIERLAEGDDIVAEIAQAALEGEQ
jgi:tRNA(Ile2) C34 agmatinyltransferase TiaS